MVVAVARPEHRCGGAPLLPGAVRLHDPLANEEVVADLGRVAVLVVAVEPERSLADVGDDGREPESLVAVVANDDPELEGREDGEIRELLRRRGTARRGSQRRAHGEREQRPCAQPDRCTPRAIRPHCRQHRMTHVKALGREAAEFTSVISSASNCRSVNLVRHRSAAGVSSAGRAPAFQAGWSRVRTRHPLQLPRFALSRAPYHPARCWDARSGVVMRSPSTWSGSPGSPRSSSG